MSAGELYIDGKIVDMGDAKIGVTSEVNDIAELKDRQGTRTNRFTVPPTVNNKGIYGNPDTIISSSLKPYRKLPVKYVEDGIELIPAGYSAFDEASGAGYSQVIYTGILDFFNQIKGKKLTDLDLTEFDQTWDVPTIFASRTRTEGYIYSMIDWSDDLGYMTNVSRIIDCRTIFANIFMHTLIEKIFDATPYKCLGAIKATDKYKNALFPFNLDKNEYDDDFVLSNSFKVRLRKSTNPSTTSGQIGGNGNPLDWQDETSDGMYDNPNTFNTTTGIFIVPATGSYIFETQLKFIINNDSASTPWAYSIAVRKWNGFFNDPNVLIGNFSASGTGSVNRDDKMTCPAFKAVKGQYIRVEINILTGAPVGQSTITLNQASTFRGDMQKGIQFGSDIFMASYLPNMTQEDFLKSWAQIYGIVFIPDNVKKTITFKQFKELYANKSAAKINPIRDVKKKPRVTALNSTYAQKNLMLYKPMGTVASGLKPLVGLGDGYFRIDDENLEIEKTLFTLPYTASEDVTRLVGLSVVRIPKLHGGAPTNPCGLRIVMLNRQTITGAPITYSYPGYGFPLTTNDDIPLTYFIDETKLDSLGFDRFLISQEYAEITQFMFNRFKKLTAFFKLSVVDMSKFDHFVPWYLDEYANYFYVNSVKNFRKDMSTEVELIRM